MPDLSHTRPHSYGPGSRTCRKCGRYGGIIRKYGLHICRQCFRDKSEELGFKKYS